MNNSAGNTCQTARYSTLPYLQQSHPAEKARRYLSTGLTPHRNLILGRERESHGQHAAWSRARLSQPPGAGGSQRRNPGNSELSLAVRTMPRGGSPSPHRPPRTVRYASPRRPAKLRPPKSRGRGIPSPFPRLPRERRHRCQTPP